MRIVWIVLLAAFSALNVFAFATGTFAEFLDYLGRLGPWGVLATAVLVVALLIGIAWMWRDARGRGISPLLYVFLTLLTGSLGLLVYLALHWRSGVPSPTGSPAERE